MKSVIVKDRKGAYDLLKDYIGHTLKDVRYSDGTHVEQLDGEIRLEFDEPVEEDSTQGLRIEYGDIWISNLDGAAPRLKSFSGHVLEKAEVTDGGVRIRLFFGKHKPQELLNIEEQKEVLRCYRERAMHGHQNAYDDLHITLGQRFCPDVDGGE